MFLLQFCPMITTAVINNQIVIQGGSDLHIAAFGIFNAYMVYVMNAFVTGFTAGMQPIASVNYGAKANGRVRSLIKTGMIQSFIVILVVEILVIVFANPLVEFFAGGAGELADITVGALRINIALFAFGSIATLVGGYYISIGKIGLALLNSTTRVIIFCVPLLLILPRIIGLNGVWAAQPVSDAFAFVIAAVYIVKEYKRLGKVETL